GHRVHHQVAGPAGLHPRPPQGRRGPLVPGENVVRPPPHPPRFDAGVAVDVLGLGRGHQNERLARQTAAGGPAGEHVAHGDDLVHVVPPGGDKPQLPPELAQQARAQIPHHGADLRPHHAARRHPHPRARHRDAGGPQAGSFAHQRNRLDAKPRPALADGVHEADRQLILAVAVGDDENSHGPSPAPSAPAFGTPDFAPPAASAAAKSRSATRPAAPPGPMTSRSRRLMAARRFASPNSCTASSATSSGRSTPRTSGTTASLAFRLGQATKGMAAARLYTRVRFRRLPTSGRRSAYRAAPGSATFSSRFMGKTTTMGKPAAAISAVLLQGTVSAMSAAPMTS